MSTSPVLATGLCFWWVLHIVCLVGAWYYFFNSFWRFVNKR